MKQQSMEIPLRSKQYSSFVGDGLPVNAADAVYNLTDCEVPTSRRLHTSETLVLCVCFGFSSLGSFYVLVYFVTDAVVFVLLFQY